MHPQRFAAVVTLGFMLLSQSAWAKSGPSTLSKIDRKPVETSFLSGEDFRGLDLQSLSFFSANLRSANFSRSKLTNVSFLGSELTKSLFQRSKARGVSFAGADLTKADMRGADLRGADMQRANLRGARLGGAKLGKVNWSNTICPDGTNSDAHANTCLGHLRPRG